RMENVEVDESQIASIMETVNKKLEWLSKEEIIKRFVSLEFNRFLDYYKNARDINAKDEGKSGKRDNRKGSDNNRNFRGKKGENGSFARLFLNMGKKDGIAPKQIISMVNENTKDRDINIGSIDVLDSFSFFEVGEKHKTKVLNAFQKSEFNGRRVKVELAGEKPTGGSKGGKKKKKKKNQYA
ncbi:MAG: DbpA RNA binding domain-containing protein, partial [Bacteroidales bacterium]|nr:DbpA RNA binding domain-containing protein [Bacteroidales bacterium]